MKLVYRIGTIIIGWTKSFLTFKSTYKAKTIAISFDHHCTKTTMDHVTDISKLILIGSIIRICTSIRARHCF